MSLFDLTGKSAIVTGGSKGIGAHIAITLAQYGADVAVISRDVTEGEVIAEQIRKLGRKSIALSADVQSVNSLNEMVNQVKDAFGKIDILVNNAGVGVTKFAMDLTEEDWDKVVDTNLKGVFFCSQAVAKVMKEQNYGKIINISSVGGAKGSLAIAPYNASKAGVINLTRALGKEWARHNIYVNSIGPGYIKTAINAKNLENEKFLDKVLNSLVIKRIGEVEDVSGTLLLLASDASNYMTGQTIFIDGGSLS